MSWHGFKRFLIGRPLKNQALARERLGKVKALAILSSDALSSVAYATQEILLVLAPLGALALFWSLPLTLLIVGLALILVMSYRQIIFAYPNGGGAYTVARENLGTMPSLVAAAALLIDYTLTVAVSVTAGVAAITSAFPAMLPYTVLLSVLAIGVIMVLNLRGITESATVFMFPTYLFIFGILLMGLVGTVRLLFFHAGSLAMPDLRATSAVTGVSLFLLMRAFSGGCSALTGVEAISNGVPMFKEPRPNNASRTLLMMGILLSVMFLITGFLAYAYRTVPSPTQTVVSQLASRTFGRGLIYYYIQATTAGILVLAANTAFNGFPLLAGILAQDSFLPRILRVRGDRLAFSNGIIILGVLASLLVVVFQGDTNYLIPLYAIGVFLSFTLAQMGMVRRWLSEPSHHMGPVLINGVGAVATALVLVVFGISKFTEGAWIVFLLIPLLVLLFYKIHGHYVDVADQLRVTGPMHLHPVDHLVLVPIAGINRIALHSVAYAKTIAKKPVAIYVAFSEEEEKKISARWQACCPDIELRVLRSQYRSILRPLLRFLEGEARLRHDQITVIIPEFIPKKWWHKLLHNRTSWMIRNRLLEDRDVVVTTVPYHLRK